jgi:hypothetical protein
MVDYDEVRKWSENLSAEEKLSALRTESFDYLATIKGYSQIILMLVQERDTSSLPDKFIEWCENLKKSAENLETVIEAVTDKQHRSIRQAQEAKRYRETSEGLWADAQQGLPELSVYTSLGNAIQTIAYQRNLSFKISKVTIDESNYYPGGIVHFNTAKRRLRVGTQGSGRNYLGYHLVLSQVIDERNMKLEEYEGITKDLSQAVEVIYQWFDEDIQLSEILEQNTWIKFSRNLG